MKEEIWISDRLIFVECNDVQSCEVLEFFLNVIESFRKEVGRLMDKCGIPLEIDLSFKPGNKKLDGIYHVQKKEVSKHLIAIDIFTKHLQGIKNDDDREVLMKNLLETFLHELLHHKYPDESKTDKEAKKIVRKILRES